MQQKDCGNSTLFVLLGLTYMNLQVTDHLQISLLICTEPCYDFISVKQLILRVILQDPRLENL